jgi:hypothetical protein
VIEVLESVEGGWWNGKKICIDGTIVKGWFPATMVKIQASVESLSVVKDDMADKLKPDLESRNLNLAVNITALESKSETDTNSQSIPTSMTESDSENFIESRPSLSSQTKSDKRISLDLRSEDSSVIREVNEISNTTHFGHTEDPANASSIILSEGSPSVRTPLAENEISPTSVDKSTDVKETPDSDSISGRNQKEDMLTVTNNTSDDVDHSSKEVGATSNLNHDINPLDSVGMSQSSIPKAENLTGSVDLLEESTSNNYEAKNAGKKGSWFAGLIKKASNSTDDSSIRKSRIRSISAPGAFSTGSLIFDDDSLDTPQAFKQLVSPTIPIDQSPSTLDPVPEDHVSSNNSISTYSLTRMQRKHSFTPTLGVSPSEKTSISNDNNPQNAPDVFTASWHERVPKDILEKMSAKEKLRMTTIWELITTERDYIRDIKLVMEV